MLYFINPAHRAKSRKRSRKRTAVDKRRKRPQNSRSTHRSVSVPARNRQTLRGLPMAGRRRARKSRKLHANAPKRRRRRRTALALNPRRRVARRRRRRAVALNPRHTRRRRHTRRYHRNPGLGSAKGLVGDIVQGFKDGAIIVGGQVAARKARGAITGMLPAATQATVKSGVGYVALSIASAIGVSLAAKKFLPAQARMLTGGAFSEAINAALAQTPIAPYLGAFKPVRLVPGVKRAGQGAWAASNGGNARRVGQGAWARQVGTPVGMAMGTGM